MPALCKVTFGGQCINPPISLCIWIGSSKVSRCGLVLYCEEHTEDFKLFGAIKVLEARR